MNDIRGGVYGRCYTTDPNFSYEFDRFGSTFTVNASMHNALYYGLNFQEQWNRAIDCNPDIVFVTGWNEWVAGRHEVWQGSPNAFPDQFNNEFSRDIEPTKGALADHYYMQLVANIRRYKGLRCESKAVAEKSINITDVSSWDEIVPENHYRNTTPIRDNNGWKGCHYANYTSRNEVIVTKNAVDSNNIYFYAECSSKITEPDDKWMRLFISCDKNDAGWDGFNYIVNRKAPGVKAVLERSTGGWNWEYVGEVEYSLCGNKLVISVPRTLINQRDVISLSYKWADNNCLNGDILSFYTDGNTAPGGRFTIKVHN